ncbi:hypothetical protein Poli38472_005101 [Pythium oligandrum]|uniref:Damage-inducible protein DinB n=1 Tax=Pythium oligandrum TaxID=41045 RepID=A0A8K1CHB4_PYTOL|nr:hypothetical protein Poli38472_005101 [Pythium oligandrum]|eukprot:TMW62483.1 hypothetical protein Poli38472_005101 [Pythium oligandrum]
MALRRQLLTMAQYNLWATRRLFIAVDALSDEEYRSDVGLFFKSVHGTLNHIYVAEHDVWYPRIHDGVFPQGIALDGEVENDREKLKQMLLTKAERWVPLLESCSDERLEGVFEYQDLSGVPNAKPFSLTMAHVFNHGTHHRGQVSAGVTMLGHPAPVLDLVYMLDGVGK